MKIEVTGIFRCVELPLTFDVTFDKVSGPAQYRREWWETEDEGKTWRRRTDIRSTDSIKQKLLERHGK